MERSILKVLTYFSPFSYPPTEQEVHMFISKKIKSASLSHYLKILEESNKITSKKMIGETRYALSINVFRGASSKLKYGKSLFAEAQSYLQMLRFIPSVKYLGISGSLSMKYISGESDIDIFVITARQTIWQTRFALLVYKHLLKVFFPHIGKKLCFNLFFAEDGLCLRKNKQTEYIGHELLQLKTIINKQLTYESLKSENRWIVKFFQNVHINTDREKASIKQSQKSYSESIIENMAKKVQKWWLKHKKLKFDDFGAQVWFIQDDFELKMHKNDAES